MRAAAAGLKVRDLVLWDPVIDGTSYLRELESVEERRLGLLNYPEPNDTVHGELMGYAFTDELRAATGAIDLLNEALPKTERVMIIAASETTEQRTLSAEFARLGGSPTLSIVDDARMYSGGGHPLDSLLAHQIPLAIASYLTRSTP